jgi:hypothetical protein
MTSDTTVSDANCHRIRHLVPILPLPLASNQCHCAAVIVYCTVCFLQGKHLPMTQHCKFTKTTQETHVKETCQPHEIGLSTSPHVEPIRCVSDMVQLGLLIACCQYSITSFDTLTKRIDLMHKGRAFKGYPAHSTSEEPHQENVTSDVILHA